MLAKTGLSRLVIGFTDMATFRQCSSNWSTPKPFHVCLPTYITRICCFWFVFVCLVLFNFFQVVDTKDLCYCLSHAVEQVQKKMKNNVMLLYCRISNVSCILACVCVRLSVSLITLRRLSYQMNFPSSCVSVWVNDMLHAVSCTTTHSS